MNILELQEAFEAAQKNPRLRKSFVKVTVQKIMDDCSDVVRSIWYSSEKKRVQVAPKRMFREAQYGFPDMETIAALDAYAGKAGTRSDIAVYPRAFDDKAYYSIVGNFLCTIDHETRHARDIALDPYSVRLQDPTNWQRFLGTKDTTIIRLSS
jgi:hypothetical protein